MDNSDCRVAHKPHRAPLDGFSLSNSTRNDEEPVIAERSPSDTESGEQSYPVFQAEIATGKAGADKKKCTCMSRLQDLSQVVFYAHKPSSFVNTYEAYADHELIDPSHA